MPLDRELYDVFMKNVGRAIEFNDRCAELANEMGLDSPTYYMGVLGLYDSIKRKDPEGLKLAEQAIKSIEQAIHDSSHN